MLYAKVNIWLQSFENEHLKPKIGSMLNKKILVPNTTFFFTIQRSTYLFNLKHMHVYV